MNDIEAIVALRVLRDLLAHTLTKNRSGAVDVPNSILQIPAPEVSGLAGPMNLSNCTHLPSTHLTPIIVRLSAVLERNLAT